MKKTVKNLITWSPSHLITSPKSAFTLAEVLITLAIIGVVAAMTIPTLVANYQKNLHLNRFKKAYSTLNNGFKLMLAQEGVDTLAGTQFYKDLVNAQNSGNLEDIKKAYQDNITKYFKTTEICISETVSGCPMYEVTYYSLNNEQQGNIVDMPYFTLIDGAVLYGTLGIVFLDTNGKQGPNIYGRDVFVLTLTDNIKSPLNTYLRGSMNENVSVDYFNSIPSLCGTIGSNEIGDDVTGIGCSDRIILEGWKMNY